MTDPKAQQPLPAYATATRRAAALLTDFVFLALATLLLHKVVFSFFVYSALCLVGTWAYFTGFESSPKRATPGKQLYAIYVADERGRRIALPVALKRFFLFTLPFLPLTIFTFSDRYAVFNDKLRLLSEIGDKAAIRALLHSPDTVYMASEQVPLLCLGLLLSVFFYWLPIVMIPQKTGLHDLGAKTRVFRNDTGGLRAWFRASYGVETKRERGGKR